jgi:hypothetical protein
VSFATGGNSEPLRVSGWGGTESQMIWTEGTAAVLAMRVSPTNDPVVLRMKFGGLTKDPEVPYQPVDVYVNDQKVADWQLVTDPSGVQRVESARDNKAPWSVKNYAENSKGDLAQGIGNGYRPRILGVACLIYS